MKHLIIFLLSISILMTNCKNEETSTPTDNTTVPAQPTIDYDAPFAKSTRSAVPVYHALIGVTNPYGGARMDYLRDMVVNKLHSKYLYIDEASELHLVDNADSVFMTQLHPNVRYIMKTHVYDGEAPTGYSMQLVNVSFTNSEATNVSRTELADRPDWYSWNKEINMSNFPKTCNTADVECKATNLLNNVMRMAFL